MEQLTEQHEFPCENSWTLNIAGFSPYVADGAGWEVPGCDCTAHVVLSVHAKEEFPLQGLREMSSSSSGYRAAAA